MMGLEWTRQIAEASPYREVIPAFLKHIAPIGILPEQIMGKVLIIGQGSAFPEKSLITIPDTGFEKLRDGVETVYCCDPTYPSSPELHLEVPYVNTITHRHIPKPQPNMVYGELSSCYHFLPKTKPNFFDTILMFRVVDLGTQIKELGLIEKVALHLRKGGLFIGSGGRFPDTPPVNFFQPLRLITSIGLSNLNDGYPFSNNRGIVLQK